MTLASLLPFLCWSTVINYGILTVWWVTALKCPGLYDLAARWFRVPREKVDAINFGAIFFNLVPLIALYIVGPHA